MQKSGIILLALCSVTLAAALDGENNVGSTEAGRLAAAEHVMSMKDTSLTRPDGADGGALVVNMQLTPIAIERVDERSGLFGLTAYVNLKWTDPRLAYDESLAKMVRVKATNIWKPDIELYNMHSPGMQPLNNDVRALVSPSGEVHLVPAVHLPSICNMTGAKHRTYNCTLKFGSWTHNGEEIDLQFTSPDSPDSGIDLSNYVIHPKWEILAIDSFRKAVTYVCCPESFIDLRFSFKIKARKPKRG